MDALCQVWLKFAQWYWRRLLNFVIVLSLFRYCFPLEKDVALHLWILNPHHSSMLCAKFGLNWSSGSGEKDLYTLLLYFYYLLLSSHGIACGHSFELTWIPLTQACSVPCLVKIGLVVIENFLKIPSMYFHLPLERAWPFKWTNFNPFHPSMLCAKFGRNWPSGSVEEDF